jgi:predicted metalloprotease with PDZ domain
MKTTSIIIGVALATSLAAAAYVLNTSPTQPPTASGVNPADYFDQTAATEERIRALEAAVAEERNARQLLEEELQALYVEIDRLNEPRIARAEARGGTSEAIQERIRRFRGSDIPADQAAFLVEFGFSPDRAEWISQRESELQMEIMQAQFEARRAGERFDPFAPGMNPGTALRAEIGDAEYEQYLEAYGRQTSVSIGSVLESSPGQRAGLQSGDEIMRYGGARVFSTQDLNQQIMIGEPGESVVVDVKRDGVLMQVVLPRGPIGVTTGRFRGRR